MKEPQWDDSIDDSKEFFDAAAILTDDDADDTEEEAVKAVSSKNRITELRRRIEERLDSKRIAHEFDYEELDAIDLDGLLDSMS